jgi:DNA-binding transcriptional MerR regulator
MTEYRIDELAREAGTTVRNVRAYQERGLLAPPAARDGPGCSTMPTCTGCG